MHEQEGARLGEGSLVTPQMLLEIMASLGRPLSLELLPERVLARSDDTIIWRSPAQRRRMFFSAALRDPAVTKLSGAIFPHPPLLCKARGKYLWVRALRQEGRPEADTRMFLAPYWNCYDNGAVCTGSMHIPQERAAKVIDSWEEAFFASEFTHGAGVKRHTHHPEGLLAMWLELREQETFPAKYLVSARQTLEEFIHDHDSSYRNDAG